MEGVEPLKAWMLDPLTQALSLVDRPRPEPGPQQVLIQVSPSKILNHIPEHIWSLILEMWIQVL
ncbi:MAG: hypothetical protein EB114_07720, partial [Betaproteobacteria bacterium]|nr:hypothetical protein [Betaproteobacteria bacterium]